MATGKLPAGNRPGCFLKVFPNFGTLGTIPFVRPGITKFGFLLAFTCTFVEEGVVAAKKLAAEVPLLAISTFSIRLQFD